MGINQSYQRTQQEVGSDYKHGSHQAGCPKTGAGESANHRGTPQGRCRVESVHVNSLPQNNAGTQKSDPGDYLRRNPRGVSLTHHRGEHHETTRTEGYQRVGPQACDFFDPISASA